MKLHLSSGARNGAIKIEAREDNGSLSGVDQYTFDRDSHFASCSKNLAVPKLAIVRAVDGYRRDGTAVHDVAEPAKQLNITVRGRYETADTATPVASFADALLYATEVNEPLIIWDTKQALCAVDVDFTQEDAPSETLLLCFAERLTPRPSLHWRTKSKGLRLIYTAIAPYTADELAALAALQVSIRFPLTRIELKHDTRHPSYPVLGLSCGIVYVCSPTSDCGILSRIGAVEWDTDPHTQFLADRGLEPGKRYDHGHCPLNPDTRRGASNSNPVVCFADHIHCYICAADGVTYRSRTAGHFALSALTATAQTAHLRNCVSNLTHYAHARHIVEPLLPRNRVLAPLVYRAALKQRHGDDLRIPSVFSQGEGIIRKEGLWATERGEALGAQALLPVLESLPAASQIVDGKPRVSRQRVAMMTQPIDLTSYGYSPIVTLWGCRVWSEHSLPEPNGQVSKTQVSSRLKHCAETTHPRYVVSGKRMSISDAWKQIETIFPGIPRAAVTLLIAARGCVEGQVGIPPMLFLTGPTGAGKTTCVKVAAAILGDSQSTIRYNVDADRVSQYILASKDRGSYATFDEFVKKAKRDHNGNSLAAMETLLQITPDSMGHKLYVGSVALGTLPVCVWCDSEIPPTVAEHAQIARRLTHVPLDESHREWEALLASSGIHEPENLRANGTAEMIAACNAILSDVIDTYFQSATTFGEIAKQLGFAQLDAGDASADVRSALSRFFDAVCAAPCVTGGDASRLGANWKLIPRDATSNPLAEAWQEIADGRESTESRKLSESDLRQACGLALPCKCEIKTHGRKLFVRFRNKAEGKFNEQLRRVELEPRPVESRPDGLGDAIDVQSEISGFGGIPTAYLNAVVVGSVPNT